MRRKRSRGSTARLEIELNPSLLGQGLFTALAIGVLGVAFYLQLQFYVFLAVVLAAAGVWAWLLHRMNNPAWRRLLLSPDGQIVLVARNGPSRAGPLAGKPLVTPLVIRLSIRTGEGEHHSAWIFADSVRGDGYRRLGEALKR